MIGKWFCVKRPKKGFVYPKACLFFPLQPKLVNLKKVLTINCVLTMQYRNSYLSKSPLDICGAKSFCTAKRQCKEDKVSVLTASISCHSWGIGNHICRSVPRWLSFGRVSHPSGLHWVKWAAGFCGTAEWKTWVSKQGYSYSFPSRALLISSTSHPLFLAKVGPELESGQVPSSEVFQLEFRSPPHSYESTALWEQQKHSLAWAEYGVTVFCFLKITTTSCPSCSGN